jgi:hypothetical protein
MAARETGSARFPVPERGPPQLGWVVRHPKYFPAKAKVVQRAELLEIRAFRPTDTVAFAGRYLDNLKHSI